MDTAQRLQRVESIEQIRRLKAVYCDYCDEGYDADGLCSLFTEDGVWDGGRLAGRWTSRDSAMADAVLERLGLGPEAAPVRATASVAQRASGRGRFGRIANFCARPRCP